MRSITLSVEGGGDLWGWRIEGIADGSPVVATSGDHPSEEAAEAELHRVVCALVGGWARGDVGIGPVPIYGICPILSPTALLVNKA